MIIKADELKAISQIILSAVDSNELSLLTETLELIVKDNIFHMNVPNREYYASVKLSVNEENDFHATVNANLFLKLISQISTEEIEFNIKNNTLEIKGNGKYKLPLIYDGDVLLEFPKIIIKNVTNNFDIKGSILGSIVQYNSRQLNVGVISNPIQRLYYVDEKGAITFTSGACINNFTLEKPIKMLLNNKLVKLFKLFKDDDKVHFTIGYDNISDEIVQTKVKFENDVISISAILSADDSMINSVPATVIRNRAETNYPYSVVINKETMLSTINRFLLFTSNGSKFTNAYCKFNFNNVSVTITDINENNVETIDYVNQIDNMEDTYSMCLDLIDLKSTLEGYVDPYINLKFGDHEAVTIHRGNIVNVIPECDI